MHLTFKPAFQRQDLVARHAEKHYTFGGDFRLSKFWDLGFHYSRATQSTLTTTSPMPASIGLEIDTVGINLGYRF